MAHHIIYVPGIGDSRSLGQERGIAWWRIFGVRPHYHPVGWAINESWDDKLAKLLAEIDRYVAAGDYVSLVGFSAGASAVLNAFTERKSQLSAVICISGKIHHPSSAANYFRHSSAFHDSLYSLQPKLLQLTATDNAKLLTLNPLEDKVVPYQDAIITGVKQWRIFAFSHVMAIIVSLTIYSLPIVLHAKRLQKQNKAVQ